MKIQVMSAKKGHQELVCLQKEKLPEVLNGIDDLKRGWEMWVQLRNGEQWHMQRQELEQKFEQVDRVLIRPPIVAG